MDFAFSEEQDLLRQVTKRFLDDVHPLSSLRPSLEAPEIVDRGLWRKAAELGWTSMLIPGDHGGGSVTEQPLVDLVVLGEELGRVLHPGPFVPTNVVADAIARHGTEAQRAQLLPSIARGDVMAAWCASADGSIEISECAVDLDDRGGAPVLNGVARFSHGATIADLLLVLARTAEGPKYLVVPSSAPGIHRRTQLTLDLTRRFAEVNFDHVAVGADQLLVRTTEMVHERAVGIATVLQSAEAVGAADHLFDATVDYLGMRTQFGRTIASFQAIKHRLADLLVTREGMRAATHYAALALGDGFDDAVAAVHTAGSYVPGGFAHLCGESLQLHGGIGFTWEHDVHLFVRRAFTNQGLYGDSRWHRERLCAMRGSSLMDITVAEIPRRYDEFTSALRACIAANRPTLQWKQRSGLRVPDDERDIAALRQWVRALDDAGYRLDRFSLEDTDPFEQRIIVRELGRVGIPYILGNPLVSGALKAYGTKDQQRRYLPPMARGDHIWTQLFSEPNAGSDLASLQTSARLEGDHYIVNGQKVWSTWAQWADYGYLLARTEPVPGPPGISAFILNMNAPGVEVRPLREMTGTTDFNEVFLDDVAIPVTDLIGQTGNGWVAAQTSLLTEREGVGGGRDRHGHRRLGRLGPSASPSRTPGPRRRRRSPRDRRPDRSGAHLRCARLSSDHEGGQRVDGCLGCPADQDLVQRDEPRGGRVRHAASRQPGVIGRRRSGGVRRWEVAGPVSLRPRTDHRRRFQRNHAKRDRRARARPAEGASRQRLSAIIFARRAWLGLQPANA